MIEVLATSSFSLAPAGQSTIYGWVEAFVKDNFVPNDVNSPFSSANDARFHALRLFGLLEEEIF